jgi:DNA repair exonuclease SbcCD ATPase subunit
MKSWSPKQDASEFVKTDVFLGHNSVSFCTDVLGHQFANGFKKEELWNNYKLSIIGDIHNPQVFTDTQTGHKILIPGQPLQSNFSSGECGVWLAEFDENNNNIPTLKFVPTKSLPNACLYHYFEQKEPSESDLKSYPLSHWKASKTAKISNKQGDGDIPVVTSSVIKLVDDRLSEFTIEHLDEIKEEIHKICDNAANNSVVRKINPTKFIKLKVANFLSILEEVILEFGKENDSILVYSSANGAGKSTLTEALYWVITGELTKDLEVADISCDYGSSPAIVQFDFLVNCDEFRIVRSRNKDSLLRLYKGDVDITKDSTANTQKFIYDLIGLTKEDISLLMYFSLNELNLFTSMRLDKQLEVISQLSNVDMLDELKLGFKPLMDKIKSDLADSKSKESLLDSQYSNIKSDIDKTSFEIASDNTIFDVESAQTTISDNESQIAKLKERSVELKPLVEECRAKLGKLQENAVKENRIKLSIAANKESLRNLLSKLQVVNLGKCHTCGHELVDDSLKESLNNQISTLSIETKKLSGHEFSYNEGEILELQSQLENHQSELEKCNFITASLVSSNSSLSSQIIKSQGSDKTVVLKTLKEQLDKISGLLKELPDIKKLESRLESYNAVSKIFEKNSKNPIYTSLLNSTYNDFVSLLSEYLIGTGIEIKLEKNYSLGVKLDNGKYRSINALSGGEKRLLDFVILMALNKLYQKTYNIGTAPFGVQMYDEVFTYMSSQYLQTAHALLDNISGITLIISNDANLIPMFDSSIFVEKTKSGSKFTMSIKE